jgi:hypothetical protein
MRCILPYTLEFPGVTLTPYHPASLGYQSAALTSATWPSANRAYYYPFRLAHAYVLTHLFIENGSEVSGNFDLGIYTVDGRRLASTGSTAQSGVSAPQSVAVSLTLGPGVFYLAAAFDNTTATVQQTALNAIAALRPAGVFLQASAFPLPATATFANLGTSSFVPMIGATGRSVL